MLVEVLRELAFGGHYRSVRRILENNPDLRIPDNLLYHAAICIHRHTALRRRRLVCYLIARGTPHRRDPGEERYLDGECLEMIQRYEVVLGQRVIPRGEKDDHGKEAADGAAGAAEVEGGWVTVGVRATAGEK